MKRPGIALILAAAALTVACSRPANNEFIGRWNMTVSSGQEQFPSWMEVLEADGGLQVQVQGRTEGVGRAAAVARDGERLIVTVRAAVPERPAAENRPASPASPELVWELTAKDGGLTGTQRQGSDTWQLAGVRSPVLQREAPAAWGSPEPLFNGKDLTGWSAINNTPTSRGGSNENWVVRKGELVKLTRGSNLRTTRTFDDFKLHAEYNCLPGANSGIYLRGRYEVQVGPVPQPASPGTPARGGAGSQGLSRTGAGSVFSRLAPSTLPAFNPEWQTYDITLVGRRVTVVLNGVTVIDNQEIIGNTGGALDSNEAEPGPIYLQGDHPGEVRYRNLMVSLPKR